MLAAITLLQLIIFAGYVWFIYRRYGVLTSISASSYALPQNEQWKFAAFLAAIGLLNVFQEMEMYGALTMAGLWFTGITLRHASSRSYTNIVHTVGTIGAIVATFIGLFVLHGMWLPSAIVLVAVARFYKHKNFIWWIEIIAMLSAIIAYLFR
jgi:hypothetical protein